MHITAKPPRLIDATLREGLQAPNTIFSELDIIHIAERIAEGGADMIEVGHPYVSQKAMLNTRSVVDMQLGVPVLAHARACRPDIHAVYESRADWVGVFLGVNEISEKSRLGGRDFEALLDIISDAISYAKSLGLSVRFTIEDTSRTDQERMATAYALAIENGADRICFADSVGLMEPKAVTDTIRNLRQRHPRIEIETHFHNDRGLAMANALAAIDSGADWISVSVNGLGERCGITDHVVLAANLLYLDSRALSEDQVRSLAHASSIVSRCSGQEISKSSPVLGKYAFTHTARLHVLAVHKDKRSYEWIDPQLLGRSHKTAEITDNP
ncbi:LeuA family protein [Thalassospira povalilytica]|uniref:LeuA family protein n=1 Tax=Thalassospira povalilytica TaxID=732237 RepID=UPI001D17D919|nr:LeuA family protein [Thalassospira povalilytica]MCC4242080.1 LeuA family protein [Thalassospira povalilytica]